jgi:hypothetical protein
MLMEGHWTGPLRPARLALLTRQRSHQGSSAHAMAPSRRRGLDPMSRCSSSLRSNQGGPKTPQCRELLRPR